MATIIPTNRGRALTNAEVDQYVNQIGEITDNDLWNLASSVYGMDYDTFLVWCGWEGGERYENSTDINTNVWYLGYLCSCAAVNLYMCYSDKTAYGLAYAINRASGWYTVSEMQTRGRNLLNNYSGADNQRTMKVCYLSLANPDQRVWEFAGDYYGSEYTILHCYAYHLGGGVDDVWASMNPNGTRTYSYDVDNGGILGQGYDVYSDTGYPTKLSQFRAKIFHALACDTDYYNRWPYNLGYWRGAYFSFDCVNLLKAILCGWYDNRTVSYFQADLSRTGDVKEWEFIQECGNVSQNFAALTVTSALYMSGHIGCFVGEYERNGKIYNTIECTSGSIGTGVVSSYVDSNGWRYPDKSKPWTSGRWTHYGDLTPWLVYDVGNIDPGGNISPVNPGGGGVDPPGWQNPQLKKNLPVYMMLRNPRLFGNF